MKDTELFLVILMGALLIIAIHMINWAR